MRIEGTHVVLREQRDSDVDFYVRWFNDEDIMKKCGFVSIVTKEQILKGFHTEREDAIWFTVEEKETHEILGETGLLRLFPEWKTTDLTIILPDPSHHGKGYGTETMQLLLAYAFETLAYHRISIGVVGFNTYALQFYERVGFRKEGIQEDGYYCDGRYSDFVMMRILREEYLERKIANQ